MTDEHLIQKCGRALNADLHDTIRRHASLDWEPIIIAAFRSFAMELRELEHQTAHDLMKRIAPQMVKRGKR